MTVLALASLLAFVVQVDGSSVLFPAKISESKGEQTGNTQTSRERVGFLCLSLSFSLCAATEIALWSLYSSACKPCVQFGSLAEEFCSLVSTATGAQSLHKAPFAWTGATCRSYCSQFLLLSSLKCIAIPSGNCNQCDFNFPLVLN